MKSNEQIVFLPGWGFSPQLFSDFAKQLTSTAMLLELPILNELNLNNAVLQIAPSVPDQSTIIAWSLGGLVALKLCTLFPNKCRRLILLSTTPKFMADSDWSGITQSATTKIISIFDKSPNSLLKNFINWVNHPNQDITLKNYIGLNSVVQAAHYNKQSLSYYLKLLFHTDLRREYGAIKIPMLHLLGGKEAIILMQPKQLTVLNPSVKLYVLKDAGHALFLTHQNECIRHVTSFLQGIL